LVFANQVPFRRRNAADRFGARAESAGHAAAVSRKCNAVSARDGGLGRHPCASIGAERIASDHADLGRLRALGARSDNELNPLTFLQCLEAGALDLGKMSEQILSAVLGGDETEAFGFIEPLDCTLCHLTSLPRESEMK
jgi:hypothetical protein